MILWNGPAEQTHKNWERSDSNGRNSFFVRCPLVKLAINKQSCPGALTKKCSWFCRQKMGWWQREKKNRTNSENGATTFFGLLFCVCLCLTWSNFRLRSPNDRYPPLVWPKISIAPAPWTKKTRIKTRESGGIQIDLHSNLPEEQEIEVDPGFLSVTQGTICKSGSTSPVTFQTAGASLGMRVTIAGLKRRKVILHFLGVPKRRN